MLKINDVTGKLQQVLITAGDRIEKIKAYHKYLIENCEDGECPYADPFYWSAFRVMGCDVAIDVHRDSSIEG
jgi:hypothetical protein